MAIVKNENLSQAAKTVFLSQSAASMALLELETRLDIPLFDRVGKRLLLNANGKNLLPKAIEIIERVSEIETSSQNQTGQLRGELKVGASTTIGNYLMPRIIGNFMNNYPEVTISLQVSNTQQIINELLKFNIDIAFIEDSCHLAEVHTTHWKDDQLILFSSPDYWLAKKKKISLNDLQKAKWILRESGSGTRQVVEKSLYNSLGLIENQLILGSTEAIKQAVKAGVGVSCLSKFTLIEELAAKTIVELDVKKDVIKRKFYRLLHRDKYITPLLLAFQKESSK